MGKFFKILKIICMVIFIFSFFTRVFAISDPVDVQINNVDYGVNFEYIVSNYDYFYVCYNIYTSGKVWFDFRVICSDQPFTCNVGSSQTSFTRTNGGTIDTFYIHSRTDYHDITYAFNKWNSYNISSSNGDNYTYYRPDSYFEISQEINRTNTAFGKYNFNINTNSLYCNFDLEDPNGNIIFDNNVVQNPYIVNSSEISDWSFDSLEIDLGSYEYQVFYDYLWVSYNGNNTSIYIYNDLLEDYDEENNVLYISKQKLSNYIHFVEDADINFTYQTHTVNDGVIDIQNLGTYNVQLDTSIVNELNNNSEQNYRNDVVNGLGNIENSIQQSSDQAHQDAQEIKDTMTDSTVESTADDLPSTDVDDPTGSGIDNIFQSIYNAFCTGQASNIVFPIPFTNKNITLSPYYVRDMLNNNGAGWVYTLIQAFWGYLIGRYIIKDISKKVTKIKGGNIENIENDNVKEEML